jgi:hypothetical protein
MHTVIALHAATMKACSVRESTYKGTYSRCRRPS